MKLRNIGIVAHVDAGKTTLTEQILLAAGRIRRAGRVDDGEAQLDFLPVERARGISVVAAATHLQWRDHVINLIDTPGHIDFASEVARTLRVLDGVIVVVSGVDGVQSYTRTLWEAIASLGLPALFFVNKLDGLGADFDRTVAQIRRQLTPHAVPVIRAAWETKPALEPADEPPPERAPAAAEPLPEAAVEALAEVDEAVLARYVESEPMSPEWLRSRLAQHARSGRLFPIMGGSALHNVGVRALLDAVVSDLPPPKINAGDTLSALVFKVQREPQMGRMAFVRLYGGRIESRQSLANATRGGEEKVTQVRKIHAASHADVGAVAAGDIAALCGLSQAKIGDVLGDPAGVPGDPRMPEPILQVKVQPAGDDDHTRLAEALLELEDEDPALKVAWNADIRELTVRVMGAVQVEILAALLASRFDLTARFDQPTVIFKETPAGSGHGFVSYTSIPHWAVMRFAIEPGERGSGVHYTCAVSPRDIKYRYQREVERRVPFALQQGPKGWEVTDVRVTLVEGSDHERHTHPLDFVAATVWGIEDGLQNTGTKLLEPILAFHLSAPAEFGGRIASELIALRAVFDPPEYRGEFVELRGEVPAATTLEYPLALRRLTGGRATLDWRLARYDLAPEAYNDDPAYTQPKRPWVSFKGFM